MAKTNSQPGPRADTSRAGPAWGAWSPPGEGQGALPLALHEITLPDGVTHPGSKELPSGSVGSGGYGRQEAALARCLGLCSPADTERELGKGRETLPPLAPCDALTSNRSCWFPGSLFPRVGNVSRDSRSSSVALGTPGVLGRAQPWHYQWEPSAPKMCRRVVQQKKPPSCLILVFSPLSEILR